MYFTAEEKLLKIPRCMAIKLNGTYQLGRGVYISLLSPYKAKIILNGKEFIAGEAEFLDLEGYNDEDALTYVISRNIQLLMNNRKKKLVILR